MCYKIYTRKLHHNLCDAVSMCTATTYGFWILIYFKVRYKIMYISALPNLKYTLTQWGKPVKSKQFLLIGRFKLVIRKIQSIVLWPRFRGCGELLRFLAQTKLSLHTTKLSLGRPILAHLFWLFYSASWLCILINGPPKPKACCSGRN